MELSGFLRDILPGCVKLVWKCVCTGGGWGLGESWEEEGWLDQSWQPIATRNNHTVASRLPSHATEIPCYLPISSELWTYLQWLEGTLLPSSKKKGKKPGAIFLLIAGSKSVLLQELSHCIQKSQPTPLLWGKGLMRTHTHTHI